MKNKGRNGIRRESLRAPLELEDMDFDTTDSPDPVGRTTAPRPTRPTVSTAANPKEPKQYPTSHLPGLPPEKRRVREATPFGGPERRSRDRSSDQTKPIPMGGPQITPQQAAQQLQQAPLANRQQVPRASSPPPPPAAAPRRRSSTPTAQFQMSPDTPLQSLQGLSRQVSRTAPSAKTEPGEYSWDVYVNGAGVYKVPAPDENTAKSRAQEYLAGGGDPEHAGQTFAPSAFQAVRSTAQDEGASAGGSIGAGPQRPLGEIGVEIFRQLVNNRIQEIVRKKPGGGGYNLYAPNKGKKKSPKPVGEFPTRLAAKRAELARFPPKDPEALKKARKRLEKLAKDPKKQQASARKELSVKAPHRRGRPAGERKKATKEAIIQKMANELSERLFYENDLPGSPWDEKISGIDLSADKKLHKFHQDIDHASSVALGDSHRALAKVLRGMARVNPGDVARDSERNKMFMPVHLDVDGDEIGPLHLYVDGGHVKIEISPEAREAISCLEPNTAHGIRGGLMSFQEDHLPKIETAKKAWAARDSHLDSLHDRLTKTMGGWSPAETHLARQILRRGKK